MFAQMAAGVLGQQGAGTGYADPDLFWFDASETASITHDTGAVSDWADLSARGIDVAQSTGSLQPTTGATTQNGLNVLDFAADQLAATTAADWKFGHDGTLWTCYGAAKYNSGTMTILSTGTLNNSSIQFSILGTGGVVYSVSTNGSGQVIEVASAATTWAANTWTIFCLRYDMGNATAASRVAVNVEGAAKVANNARTGTPSASNPSAALQIGGQSNGDNKLTGSIAELRGYAGLHDDTQVADTISELNTKWAVY